MIYKPFQEISLSCLGMGVMRLPMADKDHIDYPKAHAILDRALEAGINYFDTAYIYQAGDSERCLGQWLQKQDRKKLYVATKFSVDANPDYEAVFEEQLRRLQTDYVDFYLIHCLKAHNIDRYINDGAIEYFLKQKELGRIRYLGFSTHADLDTLTRFADHHCWDFAQIQMNYYDWVYGTAAKEYELLTRRNIPLMVMEPVRGGRLATLTPETEKMLRGVHPDWTMASWALRFVHSYEGIQVILSGMSDLTQLEDNLHTFSEECGLSPEDHKRLLEVGELFHSQIHVPCTGCRYCTEDCPMQIDIPAYINLYNRSKSEGEWVLKEIDEVQSKGKPWDCVACGACIGRCPQNIDVPNIMAKLAKK